MCFKFLSSRDQQFWNSQFLQGVGNQTHTSHVGLWLFVLTRSVQSKLPGILMLTTSLPSAPSRQRYPLNVALWEITLQLKHAIMQEKAWTDFRNPDSRKHQERIPIIIHPQALRQSWNFIVTNCASKLSVCCRKGMTFLCKKKDLSFLIYSYQ